MRGPSSWPKLSIREIRYIICIISSNISEIIPRARIYKDSILRRIMSSSALWAPLFFPWSPRSNILNGLLLIIDIFQKLTVFCRVPLCSPNQAAYLVSLEDSEVAKYIASFWESCEQRPLALQAKLAPAITQSGSSAAIGTSLRTISKQILNAHIVGLFQRSLPD